MNEVLRDALGGLDAAGIKPTVSYGKHAKVSWHDATGRRLVLVVSTSPSDTRARLNSRAVLRRLLDGRSRTPGVP
jgi:hypothetical protein